MDVIHSLSLPLSISVLAVFQYLHEILIVPFTSSSTMKAKLSILIVEISNRWKLRNYFDGAIRLSAVCSKGTKFYH